MVEIGSGVDWNNPPRERRKQSGVDWNVEREEAKFQRVRNECAAMLMLSPSQLRLMAGEMSAQEVRTVQAVLKALAGKMRGGV